MEEPLIVISIYVLVLLVPTYTAWTHPNWKGILLGTLTLWAFWSLAQLFLIGRYGTGGPAGVLLVLWLLTGWLWSAGYCSVVCWVYHIRESDSNAKDIIRNSFVAWLVFFSSWSAALLLGQHGWAPETVGVIIFVGGAGFLGVTITAILTTVSTLTKFRCLSPRLRVTGFAPLAGTTLLFLVRFLSGTYD